LAKAHNVLRGTYQNILAEYDGADRRALSTGWTWYNDMLRWCEGTAMKYGTSPQRVVTAFAALSPMITVEQNKRALIEVLETGTTDLNYPANVEKAIAIIDHGIYEALRGEKVTAFAEAIFEPFEDGVPVIDRHAVSVYMGKPINDQQRKGLERKPVRKRIQNAYRKAATARKVPVHVMQAVVWESYREREVGLV
jgi:hypothetical protein